MFYIANWGTTRLLFRFPRHLIDVKQVEPYCVEDYITYDIVNDYVVLEMQWDDEEYYAWTDGEGYLDGLVGLRDDILRQDYRVLYLAWLAILHTWAIAEEAVEPPVPPGLRQLTPALHNFMEAFHLGEALVNVAAAASSSPQALTAAQLRRRIAALSRAECDDWLLRLAQGKEAQLAPAFQRHLLAGQPATAVTPGRRTAAELQALAEAEAKRIKKQQAAAAEAQRIRELETFAPKAEGSWTFVEQLIKQASGRSYEEAVQLLVKLHQLAIHEGTEAAFAARLGKIRADYARRTALIRRFDKANLP
jgi:hypothetical protein